MTFGGPASMWPFDMETEWNPSEVSLARTTAPLRSPTLKDFNDDV